MTAAARKGTAVIAGATGAIGRELIPLIAASRCFERVAVLHRRATPFAALAGGEERIVDFAARGDVGVGGPLAAVFCAIGTTQKKAGSTAAFQAVDRDIPAELARWAAHRGARTFVVISSLGADAASGSVYMRTKGEMEAAVEAAGVDATYILRPSLLAADRDEFRLAERIGNRALSIIGPVMIGPLRRYRAVSTRTVARAMLAVALEPKPGVHIVESVTIQDLGRDLGAPIPDAAHACAEP